MRCRFATKEEFQDFIVRFEWRAHKKSYNSGFFIRGTDTFKNQIQIGPGADGQLFANRKEGKGVPELHKPGGEWNSWEVTCIGSKVMLKVNGKLAWEVDNFKPMKGPLGIESYGSALDFKNLRIKVIEPKK